MKKRIKGLSMTIVALTVLVLSASLIGCGGDTYEYAEGDEEYFYDDSDYEDFDEEWDEEDIEGYDDYGMSDEDFYGMSDEDFYENESNNQRSSAGGYYPRTQGCDPSVFSKIGSAGEPNGKNVVVSIYMDDATTRWSESDADNEMIYDMKDYLEMACNWISSQVANYGAKAEFIYDWEQDEELVYEMKTDLDIPHDEQRVCEGIPQLVDRTVDTDSLMSKYSADNVIYMVFVNTPLSSNITSYTMNYFEGVSYPYEICYIFANVDGYQECPAGIAHEMLHTFGAPDLYMADIYGDNYGVPEEMVKYYEEVQSNDIMFTNYDRKTGDSYYDRITNEFTDLDAYYCGIADRPAEADEWGLEPSQHE